MEDYGIFTDIIEKNFILKCFNNEYINPKYITYVSTIITESDLTVELDSNSPKEIKYYRFRISFPPYYNFDDGRATTNIFFYSCKYDTYEEAEHCRNKLIELVHSKI